MAQARPTATDLSALGHTEYIPASLLQVDERYQRSDEINWATVRRIQTKPNLVLLETLTVARRGDNSNFIVDGQHRWLGFSAIDPDYLLPCRVHLSHGLKWEADLYYQLNVNRIAPSSHSRYKSAVAAGNEYGYSNETQVHKMLDDLGISYVNSRSVTPHSEGSTARRGCVLLAIGTVLRQNRNSHSLTERSLGLIKDSWDPREHTAYAVPILSGMFLLTAAHSEEFDNDDMIAVMKSLTPPHIMEGARMMKGTSSLPTGGCVARIIAEAFNQTRHGRQPRLRDISPSGYTTGLASYLTKRRNAENPHGFNPTGSQTPKLDSYRQRRQPTTNLQERVQA